MIKKGFLSTVLVSFALLSCNLDGVKTVDTDENVNDPNLLSDTAINEIDVINENSTLLADTINGKPNNMVYQGQNGLRIEWTEKDTSRPIKLNDLVMVNYKARVASGEQYDSNEEIGEPVPIKSNIGMLVKGFEEGLLLMHVGDKGRILIPSALGYGENGYSTIVPPKANLVIDIEIIRRVEPIVLEEGVKVYIWKKNKNGVKIEKNELITFDYFAYTKGAEGHLYDNSYKNNEPFSFRLENDNVIDGLHQGMGVLKNNENAFIEIPAKLAYGSKGLVDLVPKNTDVVYDVRITDVTK